MKASKYFTQYQSLYRVMTADTLQALQVAYKTAVANGHVNNRMEYEFVRRSRQLESRQ